MDTEIRRNVFADSISDEQLMMARAKGYCTMVYPGENFPVLIPAPDGLVVGQVLLEPNAEALERMAFYEGDEYDIDHLDLITEDGETMRAQYNKANEQGLVFDQPWSYRQWQLTERQALIKSSKLYMERCWRKMSPTEADMVWRELQSQHRVLRDTTPSVD
jgi:hypothetical protein